MARTLEISTQAIYQWLEGKACPRLHYGLLIERATNGQVTMREMAEEILALQARKPKVRRGYAARGVMHMRGGV